MIYSTTEKYKDLHSIQRVNSVKILVSTARLEVIIGKKKAWPAPMDTVRKFARLILQNFMNVFITELFLFLIIVFSNGEKNTCLSEGRVVLFSFLV